MKLIIRLEAGFCSSTSMLAWKPMSGAATVHSVAIHRGSQVIDVLDRAQFQILRREDRLEQAMLSGVLTASLQVPDLRVGDVLEVLPELIRAAGQK